VSSTSNQDTGVRRRLCLTAAIGLSLLALAGLAAGCGGSSTKAAASSSTEQVKQVWTKFFEGSTSAATKIALLQNGQRFASVIQAEANSPLAKQTKVVVSKVTPVSPTRSTVLYTITLAGQPALPNQTGIAVKEGGKWKVSDQSFCTLLSLQSTVPPACRGA
jgi:hypothetical protein